VRDGITEAKAAIKLLAAEGEDVDQGARWRVIRELSHPNLLRMLDAGDAVVDGTRVRYVVMEYAEENLSQVLPERALTAEEMSATLPPILDGLQFVHSKGLIHGHIKPTNILAINDQVKLSSDTLTKIGTRSSATISSTTNSLNGAYGPPEGATAPASTAGDAWQLGTTLVEMLTQKLPAWDRNGRNEPSVPGNVPEPFRDIASSCLQTDAGKRPTVAEVRERLSGKGNLGRTGEVTRATAAARQDKLAAASGAAARPVADSGRRKESAKWPMWAAIAAVVVMAFVLIARPKHSSSRAEEAPEAQQTGTASGAASEGAVPKAGNNVVAGNEVNGNDAQAGVVRRVMPQVSASAQRTVRGKLKVRIRADVDGAGNVSSAAFESAGPSKYFSRISMEAARQWKFVPAAAGETNRAWKLQFVFTRSRTDASADAVKR
jgi:outer membrane biosynthesis protein TonB